MPIQARMCIPRFGQEGGGFHGPREPIPKIKKSRIRTTIFREGPKFTKIGIFREHARQKTDHFRVRDSLHQSPSLTEESLRGPDAQRDPDGSEGPLMLRGVLIFRVAPDIQRGP